MIRQLFSKAGASHSGPAISWPQTRVVEALKRRYDSVESIGEDDGFVLYAVGDRGINFVVALITAMKSEVVEIGFLARFVGFPVERAGVERLNRALHLSVAGIEENGELYLLAGIEVAGPFEEGTFLLILEAWGRDLMLVLNTLGGGASLAAAFPIARSETARRYAENRAPETEGGVMPDLLKAYLGDRASMSVCGECGGRGRRGLIARSCEACGGSGLVKTRGSMSP